MLGIVHCIDGEVILSARDTGVEFLQSGRGSPGSQFRGAEDFSARARSRAKGFDELRVDRLQVRKVGRCCDPLVANHRKNAGSARLALQAQCSCVEQGMPRQRSCGGLRHEDVETDLLAGGLDPCGDVHGVADSRIIEAGLGTHVPDAGKSGVYSDADANLLLAAEAEGVVWH